jgi:hypothetical protein
MTWGLLSLPGQDREVSVYATEAYYAGPGSRVRRFTFRTDGFVSVHADSPAGELTTRPLRFTGKELSINYAVGKGGNARIEIQDADGRPIPGFSLEDSRPMTGDAVAESAQWKRGSDVSTLSGRPVRLRFVLQDADLYSMQFTP